MKPDLFLKAATLRFQGKSLGYIGSQVGLSRERVRQLLDRANLNPRWENDFSGLEKKYRIVKTRTREAIPFCKIHSGHLLKRYHYKRTNYICNKCCYQYTIKNGTITQTREHIKRWYRRNAHLQYAARVLHVSIPEIRERIENWNQS